MRISVNDILLRNLSGMKKYKPELYELCTKLLYDNEAGGLIDTWQSDCVFMSSSVKEEPIIGVIRDGREYYLASRYDADEAADIWCRQFKDINYKAIIIINGISNGLHIKKAQKITGKDNRIIVYEPDIDIFMTLISNIDISDIISDTRIGIFVDGLNMGSFREQFKMIYTYELAELVFLMEIPGYSRLYSDKITEFAEDYCRKEMQTAYVEKSTIEQYGAEIGDNIIINMWELFKGSSIDNLKQYMVEKKVDLENIPAIIVSAGPSLDKNIEELKPAVGKSMIIAVDSAVPKLLEHGINIDLIITVDSHKPISLFSDKRMRTIPLVVCGQSRHEVLQNHEGKLMAFSGDLFMYKLFMSVGKNVEGMQTGGSVANNAFYLAEFLGFRNIILVGQDLAFTDNKIHASNVYRELSIEEDTENEYTYVDGQDGSKMLTYVNFRLYKEWFEHRIKDNSDINVINATQGGAKIYGAVHMSLEDAVKKYCVYDFNHEIIEEVPYLFSDQQLDEVYQCILGLKEKCLELSERFEDGKLKYENLARLIKEGAPLEQIDEISAQIAQISSLDEKEPLIDLLSMYSKKEESEILMGMYDEDDGLDGAVRVTEHGIKILDVYKKCLCHIADEIDRLIKYEISKDIYDISKYNVIFVNY